MQVEIKIPTVGESIQEATIVEWFKQDGDIVQKDDLLFAIETDKVTLEIVAPEAGILSIRIARGTTAKIGAIAGILETEGIAGKGAPPPPSPAPPPIETPSPVASPPSKRVAKEEKKADPPSVESRFSEPVFSPAVRRLLAEKNLDPAQIQPTGPGGRLTKGDILLYMEQGAAVPLAQPIASAPSVQAAPLSTDTSGVTRKPMSRIRKRIAERLVAAKQNTAMLTTFNEIDMSRAMAIRNRYQDEFHKRHGVRLGFMSFFTKASVAALKEFPEINAFIEGDDIVYHDPVHMGIAIGSDRGLIVPVIRNADQLSFAAIEKRIIDYVEKIKNNQLGLEDLEGGTFTITNGGVYGSLLSTPILNLPQSGILGLHKIEKRPIVIDDAIVIRPMMYVALSYDHRIVDGREAVSFLKRIKADVEDPERLMLEV
jgi:2-oxoglutarate dehydrogenase E2 component (dihydrolipoamide succinyltransferase)